MNNHLYRGVLASSLAAAVAFAAAAPARPESLLDNVDEHGNPKLPNVDDQNNLLDSAEDHDFAITEEMRLDAASVVREWAESELESGEGYADRLYALIIGAAGGGDEDLTDDQADYAAVIAELVGDFLEGKGIPSDDIDALLGGDLEDNDLAARIHDALLDHMPQGDDAMLDDTEKFVMGDSEEAMLDAAYRKVMAIRKGKKVRINKRISGTVRLTAAQKVAVKKMQRKAFSGTAKMKRARSMRLRRKLIA
ncbi:MULTISPECIES: hypothetical protein [Pseudomonas]|uniref:hypothetical protein n=1 Tax=Pseudomonas TaxID=286 RepID=UPI0007615BF0|nr:MULTISPECIES: hypothetical protein [Pseudomonas]MDG9809413.1 hypothetical protein [Pseudomonas juntendi]MDG9815770.1 hypothetical protein [Pseudomonas putida]